MGGRINLKEYMGAGILPTTIKNGRLMFLFGKEGKYETSAAGYSDFGGGTDNSEDFFDTACREAAEETTGFLGSAEDISRMLKHSGVYPIDYKTEGHNVYRMHIFPFTYNEWLPYYYNNNQRFLQKHMAPSIFKTTKIFEKAEMRWFSLEEMMRRKKEFRSYFQNIVDIMYAQRAEIRAFIAAKMRSKKHHMSIKKHKHSRRRQRHTIKA